MRDQGASKLPYRLSSRWKWVAVTAGVVFFALGLGMLVTSRDVVSILLGVVVLSVGALTTIGGARMGIVLNDFGMISRDLHLKTHRISWNDIERVELCDTGGSMLPIPTIAPVVITRGNDDPVFINSLAYYRLRKNSIPARIRKLQEIVEQKTKES